MLSMGLILLFVAPLTHGALCVCVCVCEPEWGLIAGSQLLHSEENQIMVIQSPEDGGRIDILHRNFLSVNGMTLTSSNMFISH